jgi:hypothetical protein
MDGVGVGVPVSSGRLGRRVLALSSAVSGGEAGTTFGFAAAGGTGMLGAVRGALCLGMFGDGGVGLTASLGGGVVAGAGGRCAGAREGRGFTTDSG